MQPCIAHEFGSIGTRCHGKEVKHNAPTIALGGFVGCIDCWHFLVTAQLLGLVPCGWVPRAHWDAYLTYGGKNGSPHGNSNYTM